MQTVARNDWDAWMDFAVYSYNLGRHTTVSHSPSELMLGWKLRIPNGILRSTRITEAGDLIEYHRKLLKMMEISDQCVEQAREREQQWRYYDRKALEDQRRARCLTTNRGVLHLVAEDIAQELRKEDPLRAAGDNPATGAAE
ncbi:hypothetical protein PHMEG_00040588 [Phytophthora megakarya]|uniref:Uncharacterized protein n=1 Tax=Phytophthora megakarya TaxID=4795 RepID=A0A225UCQ7_9STRA|nr:hypothetical protein PHMEG_00040588 [Phytophthora megakarya]